MSWKLVLAGFKFQARFLQQHRTTDWRVNLWDGLKNCCPRPSPSCAPSCGQSASMQQKSGSEVSFVGFERWHQLLVGSSRTTVALLIFIHLCHGQIGYVIPPSWEYNLMDIENMCIYNIYIYIYYIYIYISPMMNNVWFSSGCVHHGWIWHSRPCEARGS